MKIFNQNSYFCFPEDFIPIIKLSEKLVSYQNFRQIQTCMQSFNDVPFVVTEVHLILCHILGVTFYDLKIQNGLA